MIIVFLRFSSHWMLCCQDTSAIVVLVHSLFRFCRNASFPSMSVCYNEVCEVNRLTLVTTAKLWAAVCFMCACVHVCAFSIHTYAYVCYICTYVCPCCGACEPWLSP